MTDENKNIENNQEENQNKLEGNKSWWKKLLTLLTILFFCMLFSELNINKIFNIKKYEDTPKVEEGEWETIDNTGIIPREFPAAHLLPDGNILIVGGSSETFRNWPMYIGNQSGEIPDIAEIYNPTTKKVIKIIPLPDKRYSHFSSISLKNGDVFISGGTDYNYMPPNFHNTAKIFDAKKYIFKDVKPMAYKTANHNSILLDNGHILILRCISNFKKKDNSNYQIYDPNKNNYYYTKNIPHAAWVNTNWMKLNNGNILIFSGRSYIYDVKKNTFEKTTQNFPIGVGDTFVSISDNEYLSLDYKGTYTTGFVFKIKEQQKIPVDNKIDRVWNYPHEKPILVPLKNGNVLILGIDEYKKKKKKIRHYKNTAYIYNREKNIFYEIYPPRYSFDFKPAVIQLKNGDIMFIGGDAGRNSIQVYKYKQNKEE